VSDTDDYLPLKVSGLKDDRTPARELRFQLEVTSVSFGRRVRLVLFTGASHKPGLVILGKTACGGVMHGVGGDPMKIRVRVVDYAGNVSPPSALMTYRASSKGRLGRAGGRAKGDRDGDGVANSVDRCPDLPGIKARKGCPKVVLAKVKGTRILLLKKIRFRPGVAVFLKSAFPVLDQVASILRSRKGMRVRIENHSGRRGSRAYNLKMTRQRARVIRDYLVHKGIDPRRLTAAGYGYLRPRWLCVHNPKPGRGINYLNNRTELHILPPVRKKKKP
jgi:outer membrane protein OmpA-like peptidoglycan-associated protein